MSSGAADGKDPWVWTTQEVIDGLNRSLWLGHRLGDSTMSDTDLLSILRQLKSGRVTGADLLILDDEGLRRELEIQDLGQRLDLLRIIGILRFSSDGFKAYAAASAVNTLRLNDAIPAVFTPPDHAKRGRIAPSHLKPQEAGQRPQSMNISSTDIYQAQYAISGEGEWDHLLHWEQAEEPNALQTDLANNLKQTSTDTDGDDDRDEPEFEDVIEEEEPYEKEGGEDEEEALPGRNGPDDDDVEMTAPTEDAQGSKKRRRAKLTSDEIAEIINERIEHFTNTWHLNKGVQEEEDMIKDDPNRIWDEAQGVGRRVSLIEKYCKEVEYFTQRLDLLCEEIITHPGGNPDKIRYQCQNLEITINNLQLAEWYLSIYSLEPVFDTEDDVGTIDHDLFSQILSPTANDKNTSPLSIDLEVASGASEVLVVDNIVNEEWPISPMVAKPFVTAKRENTPDSVLDDTMELVKSIEPTPIPTASNVREQVSDTTSAFPPQLGDEPENASIASVRRWKWQDLVDTQDRKRIVSKAIYEMTPSSKEIIRERLKTVDKSNIIREILTCITMMRRGEERMPGVLARDLGKITSFTRLFLCWWFCQDYSRTKSSKRELDEAAGYLRDDSPDLTVFCSYLDKIMGTTFSCRALREPERPSQAEIIEISSDDDGPP